MLVTICGTRILAMAQEELGFLGRDLSGLFGQRIKSNRVLETETETEANLGCGDKSSLVPYNPVASSRGGGGAKGRGHFYGIQ